MGLMFGTQEDIACLTASTFSGPNGDQVCLAQKVDMVFVGGGVHVKDAGYVLKIQGRSSYYPLNDAQLEELQAAHLIPTPLPPRHISWWQYGFGYSLWIVIAGTLLALLLKRLFGKLRPFLAEEVAPDTGPPMVRTDDDRWAQSALEAALEPGEKLQQQAEGSDFAPDGYNGRGHFLLLGLTDRRLLMLVRKRGTFSVSNEIERVESRRRDEIVDVKRDELVLTFTFSDGGSARFWIFGSQRKLTNQWLFARDVPKLIGQQPRAASVHTHI